MITTWKRMMEITTDFNNEFKHTLYSEKLPSEIAPIVEECLDLDKPIEFFTGQTLDLEFKEYDDHCYCYFGQGRCFPEDKIGFAWLYDQNSILFFERPYTAKVFRLLRKLLPDAKVEYFKNDIYINGTKNGATLRTGYQKQLEDGVEGQIISKSEPLTGMIYILRWDNLEGLNEAFKDIKHHQDRLRDKAPLSTLSDFLPNMTREQFMSLLESKSV